jgi:hypothetical protein
MMPIRFPTEAANDPDGKLEGLPESTGEDDATRSRPESRERKDRATNEPLPDNAPPREDKPQR